MSFPTNLDDRYGRKPARNNQRLAFIGAGLVALLIVAWAAWVTLLAPPTAKGTTVGYSIVDAQHATVRFSVQKPANRTAICAAKVLDKSYGLLGYREVLIPSDAPAAKVFEVTVNTTGEGVTGLIDKCWLK